MGPKRASRAHLIGRRSGRDGCTVHQKDKEWAMRLGRMTANLMN